MFYPLVNVTADQRLPSQVNWHLFPTTTVILFIIATCHYVILISAIYKTSKTSAFYGIFYISGIANIIHCVSLIWIVISRKCFSGPYLFHITNIAFIMDYILFCSNALCGSLMCFNRYCGTYFWYSKFWTTRFTIICLVIILLLSLIEAVPYSISSRTYYIEDGKWTFYSDYDINYLVKIGDSVLILITETISLILISMTYYRLKKGKREISNLEINLFLASILHVLVSSAIFLADLHYLLDDNEITLFFKINVYDFIFVNTVCDSFTIVMTHKKIRKDYVSRIKFWEKSAQVVPNNTILMVSSLKTTNPHPINAAF